MDEVSEVICFGKEEEHKRINRMSDSFILEHNGESIELISMVKILDIDFVSQSDSYNIVILRVGEKRIAVQVEEIYDFEEVVSRTITDGISSSSLYLGASLLGNGEVAMILSASGVATKAGVIIEEKKQIDLIKGINNEDKADANNPLDEFMVFNYNENGQLCVALDDVDRFEKIKISKLEVIGDNIVIRYLDNILPIVDPGYLMGLKTNSKVKQLMDGNDDLEIDIIVSRLGKQKIGLFVHALDEIQYSYEQINYETANAKGMNGSIFLNGKTICLVDIEAIYEMYKSNFVMLKRNKRLAVQNVA
jgi:two-component system chemotaxis sensor kinase CheA